MIKNEKRKDPEGSRLDRPVKGGLQPTKGTQHATALTVVLPTEDVALSGDRGDEDEAHRTNGVILDPVARATDPRLLLLSYGLPGNGVLVLDCRGQSHVGGTIFGGQGSEVIVHDLFPCCIRAGADAPPGGFC